MSLLLAKTPLFHADEIRMLACKALNGLCRSRGVRQIASKLHLMSSGQLLALMREPVLQGKEVDLKMFPNSVFRCDFPQYVSS